MNSDYQKFDPDKYENKLKIGTVVKDNQGCRWQLVADGKTTKWVKYKTSYKHKRNSITKLNGLLKR